MRPICSLVALAVLGAAAGFSQSALSPTQLEAFERFVQQPATRITWSEQVGRIATDRASAIVTALTAEDAANGRQMRGIRIELIEDDRGDRLYTSEERLNRLIDAMREIEDAPGWSGGESKNRCRGSGVFWNQQGHAFSASECVYGEWQGLVVHEGDFRFTNTAARDFGKLFVAARNKLNR